MKREILKNPFMSATELKKNNPNLLHDVSIRTIQHRLQKELRLPAHRASKKPLLTMKMRGKRMQFARKYRQRRRILETSDENERETNAICKKI